jgi:hypothetical protein
MDGGDGQQVDIRPADIRQRQSWTTRRRAMPLGQGATMGTETGASAGAGGCTRGSESRSDRMAADVLVGASMDYRRRARKRASYSHVPG